MASVLNSFVLKDPSYKETRDAVYSSEHGEKNPRIVFERADGLASGAATKLRPLLEQRYSGVTYDEVAKTEQEPGGMGGLNSMYQGMGPAWYNYYQRIETKMKKLSEERGGKAKTAGRRRTKKSKRRSRKTRRRV